MAIFHDQRKPWYRAGLAGLDDAVLNELASAMLNGRQAKTAIRTAHALAVSAGDSFNNSTHIWTSLNAMKLFEKHAESGPYWDGCWLRMHFHIQTGVLANTGRGVVWRRVVCRLKESSQGWEGWLDAWLVGL